MLLIRRFEEKAGQLYGMGLIGGFCHLYIGQEAVVVGHAGRAKEGDQVITGYRDHGHMLACGMDPKGVMAELTGRAAATPRARAARCTCSAARRTSTAATASSARRCRWARAGLRQQVSGNDNVCLHLFRRRRGQPGPGLRELQHGRAVEAAGDLRHREQPLRHGHQRSSAPRPDGRFSSAARPSASRASRWTAWTCGGARRARRP
jgi:hypothetical protein